MGIIAVKIRKYLDMDGLSQLISSLKKYYATASSKDSIIKVGYASEAGKALSIDPHRITLTGGIIGTSEDWDGSNDLIIDTELSLASSIQPGAITSVQFSKIEDLPDLKNIITEGEGVSFTDGTLTINLSSYAKKEDIVTVFTFKGSVETYDDLPGEASIGDVYHVNATGSEYVWVQEGASNPHWEELGASFNPQAILNKISSWALVDSTIPIPSAKLDKEIPDVEEWAVKDSSALIPESKIDMTLPQVEEWAKVDSTAQIPITKVESLINTDTSKINNDLIDVSDLFARVSLVLDGGKP